MLPVGETSRSDRGGGVSAEECSSRSFSEKSTKNAEQINFSVGYGIYDVPDVCVMSPLSAKQMKHIVGEGLAPPEIVGVSLIENVR